MNKKWDRWVIMNTTTAPSYLQGKHEKKIMERPLYSLDEVNKQYMEERQNEQRISQKANDF